MRDLTFPAEARLLEELTAGELIRISGVVASARDAAHQLITEAGAAPFDLSSVPVFYTGPAPAPPGRPCGSCGPTTSSRMEPFAKKMLEMGMRTAIGKGDMGPETRALFARHRAVYLAAVGGAGALCATRILSRRVIAWDHLGPEAVSLLQVRGLPVFVAWDLHGGNIYNRHGRLT